MIGKERLTQREARKEQGKQDQNDLQEMRSSNDLLGLMRPFVHQLQYLGLGLQTDLAAVPGRSPSPFFYIFILTRHIIGIGF